MNINYTNIEYSNNIVTWTGLTTCSCTPISTPVADVGRLKPADINLLTLVSHVTRSIPAHVYIRRGWICTYKLYHYHFHIGVPVA